MAPLSQELFYDSLNSPLSADDKEKPFRTTKVSFAVDVDVYEIDYLSDDDSEEAMEGTWFQKYEYNLIDNLNTELVRSFQNVWTDSSGPRPYHTTDVEVVYSSCLDSNNGPSRDDLDRLDAWVRNCNLLRGLESASLPRLANKRRKRRGAVIRSVIYLQTKISSVLYTVDERAEMIRDASEKLSQPSKEFARIMGLADQSAAKDERRRPQTKRLQRSWGNLRSSRRSLALSTASQTRTSSSPHSPGAFKNGVVGLIERLAVKRSLWSVRRSNESKLHFRGM